MLKRWRGDFKKEEYWQFHQQCFYLEELSQIQWSISKKTMEEPMKQKLEIKNIISITVLNLIQIQNLDLSEYIFNRYCKFKRIRVVYITRYQKRSDKKVYFGSFLFH